MNTPCRVAINCEGNDFPILNISSEGPDTLLFSGIVYQPNPKPCLVDCNPSRLYNDKDCHGVVYSAASQAEADLLALLASVKCIHDCTCVNEAQTVVVPCAEGGGEFHYTVPAGTFGSPYDCANP